MKKKILLLASAVICLAILATGTLAYFTSSKTAHNVITSGGITIEIEEKTTGGVDFPKEGISGVMPGTSVDKIVRVENIGAGDAWIRVKLEAGIVSAGNETLSADVIRYDVLDGWTYSGGYYYYEESVAPGDFTTELIEEVTFDPSMGNEYQGCTASLVVSAEAVQVANNGDSPLEAAGWPED